MKGTMRAVVGCLVMLSAALAGRPADAKTPPLAPKDAAMASPLAEGSSAFATDLYTRLAGKPGNLFFSPISIDTALAMTYAGAAGQTADQMAKTLHFTLPADKLHPAFAKLIGELNNPAKVQEYDGNKLVEKPAYQLSVANALWGQKGYDFKPTFLGLLKDAYRAGLNELDFKQTDAARKTINDWVAKETKDKIQNLIPEGLPAPDTRLVLTNAIYFKSNWNSKFEKEGTKDDAFRLSADKTAQVPMMRQQAHFGYAEAGDVQVLSMPYKANELDMVVLLPKKADGLGDVEKSLSGGKLGDWLKAIKPEQVDVTLPKFKFTSEFRLPEALKALGMIDAFDEHKASFPGITTKESLFISDVLHKAFVAVDEEGTEAAAATAVLMKPTAMPMEPPKAKTFKADHPFVFLIRHHASNTILFMGRVADPKACSPPAG
ncbi:MAG: serpin family protein [Phycisphaerae bacterium]|nr:serpin family protein [Phycisphaerae bacterium]